MGLGFLVLILACIGGLFALRPAAFLNSAEAKFVRRTEPGQVVVFEVTPARPSLSFLLFRAGVSAAAYWLLVSVVGGNVESLAAIGFAIWALVTFILFRPLIKSQRHRKPSRLTISPQGLTAGDRSYRLDEIAQLSVRSSFNTQAAPIRQAPVYGVDGEPVVAARSSISADVSRALHNRLAERSHLVALRTSTGSAETVISGGLTPQCAQALANDLREQLAQAARAN